MTRRLSLLALAGAIVAAGAIPAAAQSEGTLPTASPFRGSVPQGTATAEPLRLTLKDTVDRALQFNLGLLLQQEALQSAHGARWRALSDLLPKVNGSVSQRRQVINLEAFGFPAPDPIVGPFNVFDARVGLSQPVVDLRALHDARATSYSERAAASGVRSARELVVLVSVNLYLEAVTAASRIDVVGAQQETAAALLAQARDLKASGLVPGIDVLRADVAVQMLRQRRVAADNAAAKAKLRLGRAVGLPPGQAVVLADKVPYEPLAAVSLEQALLDAYAHRPDYLAAQDRLAAAESGERAANAELLPTLRLDADYGAIGQTVSGAHPTYAVAATVRVPIFEGGKAKASRLEAQALLRQRRAEVDDLRGRIDLEVRESMLDVAAAAQELEAADATVALSTQQLAQARDRFSAGVTDNLEVTQAQESLARAADTRLDVLYRHNVSKATLALAVGSAEQAVAAYIGRMK
jgi:outer membrane protein TolC